MRRFAWITPGLLIWTGLSLTFQCALADQPELHHESSAIQTIEDSSPRMGTDLQDSWIDPEQVEALELLHIGPSSLHIASVAGHLALRVRMKGKLAADDPVISIVADDKGAKGFKLLRKGLTGGFPSILQVVPLGQVQTYYAELQDRDIWRYEFQIDDAARRAILTRLREFAKTTGPGYKFLTSNCATLLIDQIDIALKSDQIDAFSFPFSSPPELVGELLRIGIIREVKPGFFSLSRMATTAASLKKPLLQALASSNNNITQAPLPTWEALESDRSEDRAKAYLMLVSYVEQNPSSRAEVFKILLLSMPEEREHSTHRDRPRGAPTVSAHGVLRASLYKVRQDPEFAPQVAQLGTDIAADRADQEMLHRMIGSTHTGLTPIIVTPTYTISSRDGHPELELSTAIFSESLGDPSGLALRDGMGLEVLPMTFVVSLDQPELSRWSAALLRLETFSESPRASGDAVKNIFQGGGLGFGLKILEFSGDHWRERALEAHWITPQILANLASSEGLKSYLMLSLGAEFGTIWAENGSTHEQDHTWLGAPIEIKSQLSLDDQQKTLLRATLAYTPRFTRRGDFESELRARISFSRLLGDVLGTELRIEAGAEAIDRSEQRFTLQILARSK